MKSADMTQQQRISAALARSGSSTAWVQETTGVAVEANDPDHSEDRIAAIQQLDSDLTPTQKSSDISHALIWSGLALAVLSCYLLVIFH
jgi:hypothetical protein